jgi:hypothetical protein
MSWRIPNLLSTGLDCQYNHAILGRILHILEKDKVISAKLRSDLKVDSWNPEIWDLDQPPEDFGRVYVHSSFKEKELIALPVNLNTGLEGQLYGVAYLNGDLEQDQMTNAFLFGFPQQGGVVPLTLFDIIETPDKSIELVDLYTSKP